MHSKYSMATANSPYRAPDCVTKVQVGNTILTVSGFFKRDGTETAVDKMMKVLEVDSILCSDRDDSEESK